MKAATQERIKVLFVISMFIRMGGAERNLYELAKNIDKKKFKPYVWVLEGGPLVDSLIRMGVDARVINLKKVLSLEGIRKGIDLVRFLRREKVDVIVSYHPDADVFSCIWGKIGGCRVIVSNRRDMGRDLSKKQIWFYRLMGGLFTQFLSVCDAVKKEMVEREWRPEEKIKIIYNGVEDRNPSAEGGKREEFKKKYGVNSSKKVIGVVGRFEPVKGQMNLVEAVKRLTPKHRKFVILCVGYTDSEYFEQVRTKIEEYNLLDYFVFAGHQEDVSPFWDLIDFLVVPSLSEGFSNAILEGMANRKSVIAYAVGGNKEAIEDEETGILIPENNLEALAKAIERLMTDEETRKKMGEGGYKRMQKFFTMGKMIGEYEKLFQHLRAET